MAKFVPRRNGGPQADLVLHGGYILGHPESDSLAVAHGAITAHGSFKELKALVGPRTRLINLSGRVVAPGFVDGHIHFLEAAAAASGVPVWRARSIADLLTALRLAAARTPPGNWLRAFGCDEALLRERRGPTRQELDQAVPRNPLRLRHQTLHASWLNSRAILQLSLEEPDFNPVEGAVMERDHAGHLTGFVVGIEQWLSGRLPRVTTSELESRARFFSRELASHGVATFVDATVRNGQAEIELFGRLTASGAISQRVAMMIGSGYLDSALELERTAKDVGVSLVAAKFMENAGADAGKVAGRVALAARHGLDCAFHSTEVEELELALTAVELARKLVPAETLHLRVEHGGLILPDHLERLATLGAWVVTNPGFIYYRGAKYALEPGLVPYVYRARSLIDAGVKLAGGTDAPVTPPRPFAAVGAAIHRITIEGYELAPEERLEVSQALELFTLGAARLARLNAGVIAPGALADLIVLPTSPLEFESADFLNVAVDLTIVDGQVVYERGLPMVAHSLPADFDTT